MNILETILESQGGQMLEKLANRYGLTPAQVRGTAQQLVPALLNGVKNMVARPGGAQQLLDTLKQGNYAQYLQNASAVFSAGGIADGNRIVEQLFGAKEAAKLIASRAADAGTVQAEKVAELLPALANLVMGALARLQESPAGELLNSAISSPLGKMLGGLVNDAQDRGGDALGLVGALLEKHDVKSIADDLLGAAGKLLRR